MRNAQPQASHFIDGQYVDDAAGAEINCVYAATGETIAVLHSATPAIIDKAVSAASRIRLLQTRNIQPAGMRG